MARTLRGFDERWLRIVLGIFFLALAVPTLVLVRQAYLQLGSESFHRHRLMAEELTARIDDRLAGVLSAEEARSLGDYSFLVVAGDPSANFLQRSPLSAYPVVSRVPGLIGYFQVDSDGTLSTPLLPQEGIDYLSYGLSEREYAERSTLVERMTQVLGQNRLVQRRSLQRIPTSGRTAALNAASRSEGDEAQATGARSDLASMADDGDYRQQAAPIAQSAFDQLNEYAAKSELGRSSDTQLRDQPKDKESSDSIAREARAYAAPAAPPALQSVRSKRKEQASIPEPAEKVATAEAETAEERKTAPLRVNTFESEIDPFEFSRLDSGHFVLFRKVWRGQKRFIQGALIESTPFLTATLASEYRPTALSGVGVLHIGYRDEALMAVGGDATEPSQDRRPLYRGHLSPPFSDLTLDFAIAQLPVGAGGALIHWVAAILATVLCAGFLLIYRLGLTQIRLARQQQDFVSAVSHELKTPLTSIRMYGEMLRAGWVSEEKRKSYYDFIYTESERLSRLISNVLQLARFARNDKPPSLKSVAVSELLDMIASKIASQAERAGFELAFHRAEDIDGVQLNVDADSIVQIFINLIDNAIKFSSKSDIRRIEIDARKQANEMVFTVRDFGPGIPKPHLKKIFRLFYRAENELTRETVGTGIGLALVHQLVTAMNGRIDVRNREPGAEFEIRLPIFEND